MQQLPGSDSAVQVAGNETHPEATRKGYETPRVTPLGEWTALTLAGSTPALTSLPLFGKSI